MRADRLLSILLLLQTGGRMSARELAERLEVSQRTIHRDMEALSTAGVPVIAERGSNGGWSLLEAYRTNLTGMTQSEIQALFLSQPPRLLADLGLRGAAEGALVKLLASLPSTQRQDAEFMRARIHIDGAGWKQTVESVPCLPLIQEGLWRERKLRVLYERSDHVCVERVVDPLGLVAKGSTWYLVAEVEGDVRTYRISRVQDATILEEPSARPEGFDLAGYWEQSKADFQANLPRYPARFRIASSILFFFQGMLRYARVERVEPPDADGWQVVDIVFDVEEEALLYGSGYGGMVEVLEPVELRDKVKAQARAVLTLYGIDDSTKS
ncbi:MAG: YafY family transcriptional regulator [Anaerolineae bacterium]|nr:YafY family transcriptional regulator [Anaerolineae bacterium]